MATPPFKVKALFDYTSEHDDDLNFVANEIITVTAEEDADWYYGEYTGTDGEKREGIFPKNFVERIVEMPPRPTRSGAGRRKASETAVPPADEVKTEDGYKPPEAQSAPAPAPPASSPPAASPPASPIASIAQTTFSPEPEQRQIKPPAPPSEETTTKPKVPVIPKVQAPVADAPQAGTKAKSPPPVAEKSETVMASFKDRLAMFNKGAAPPPVFSPNKPPVSIAKKPWVPPPPSKNAFIPPPNPYQTTPRVPRNEDPNPVSPPRPPPVERTVSNEDTNEEPVKVQSLKDRIAMLQTMQLNPAQQASKPKRPPKPKRSETDKSTHSAVSEGVEEAAPVPEETLEEEAEGETVKTKPKKSLEIKRAEEDDYSAGDADVSSAGGEPPRRTTKLPASSLRETDKENDGDDEETNEGTPSTGSGDEGAEEEDVDPEVARRIALRERMARLGGGMGMPGMFIPGMGGMGGMGGMPPKPKPKKPEQPASPDQEEEEHRYAAPIPIFPMGMPGMAPIPKAAVAKEDSESEEQEATKESVKAVTTKDPKDVVDVEDIAENRRSPSPEPVEETPKLEKKAPVEQESSGDSPPPLPSGRPMPPGAPPALPSERPSTASASAPIEESPSEGSVTDDELSASGARSVGASDAPSQPAPQTPISPPAGKRASYFGGESAASPQPGRRASYISKSGVVPPIPGIGSPPSTRAPPPPPPSQPPLPRASLEEKREESEEEVTEYEADYDTDMANKVAHRDALRPHRQSVSKPANDEDDGDSTPLPSPTLTPQPPQAIPPPPPPSAAPPKVRQSFDSTRPSSSYSRSQYEEEDESSSQYGVPLAPPLQPPPAPSYAPSSFASPPQSPPETKRLGTSSSRQSVDFNRTGVTGRRSVDQSRPVVHDYIAKDIELEESSQWWRVTRQLPPALQNKAKDLYFEVDESTRSEATGEVFIDRNYYIVFHDYSQTVITVSFNREDPSQASITQRHEPPPHQLRQDQLEEAHTQYGIKIYEGANSRLSTVVKDGEPLSLIQELFSIVPDVLPPAGSRAFGALVYANLANASVQQFDEIRPGDIITFRHARFQGHRGGLHQKYTAEVGKPEHFAVAVDWDGTKKKLRAFEQGREKGKVKIESFRMGDLKSGEVKIWRVMGRKWIGWDS